MFPANYPPKKWLTDEKETLMKLTDALLGEHAVIYQLFEFVSQTAKDGPIEDLRQAVAVLEKVLVAHAQAEENLLFSRLDPHLGGMGPLVVMRDEHQGIEELFAAINGEDGADGLKSLVAQLLDLAYGHFQKEEMALFPMAREFLDEATLSELGEQWAELRKVAVDAPGCMGAA